MDFPSDDFDLEEIDRAFETAKKDSNHRLQFHNADEHEPYIEKLKRQNEELTRSLQTAKGENAILRANLSCKNKQHQEEVRDLIGVQTRLKKEQQDNVQTLRCEIERLKTEQKFLANEAQSVAFQSRRQQRVAYNDGPGGRRMGSPSSATGSPTKKKAKRDLEAGFRDGFYDNNGNSDGSPKRKRWQQETDASASTSDRDAIMVTTSMPQIDNLVHPYSVSIESDSFQTDNINNCQRILEFYSLVLNLIVPGTQNIEFALEAISNGKYFKKEFGANSLFVCLQQTLSTISSDDGTLEAVLIPFCRQCLGILSQCLDMGYYNPCWLILRFVQITVQFDFLVVLPIIMVDLVNILMDLVKRCLTISDFNHSLQKQVPDFDNHVRIDVHNNRLMTCILSGLQLLEIIACCCYNDRNMHRKLWSLIPTEFIRTIMDHRLPVNVLLAATLMVTPAASHITLTTATTTSTIDFTDLVALVQSRLNGSSASPGDWLLASSLEPFISSANYIPTILLETISQHIPDQRLVLQDRDRDWYKFELSNFNDRAHIALKRAIVRFLVQVKSSCVTTDSSSFPDSFASNITRVLSSELEAAYTRHELQSRLGLISEIIYLLHGICSLDNCSQPRSLVAGMTVGEYHDYILALARVAFSGKQCDESGTATMNKSRHPSLVRFPDAIVDKARDILEQYTTLSEADEIFMGMNYQAV